MKKAPDLDDREDQKEHLFAGLHRLEGGSPGSPHRVHAYHMLALCVGGVGTLLAPARFPLRTGSMYLLPAGTPHIVEGARELELYGVGFCPACASRDGLGELLAPFERVRAGATAMTVLDGPAMERLRGLMRLLQEELTTGRDAPYHVHTRRAALTLVLAEVARLDTFTVVGTTPPLVADALRIIERRCLEPLTLRDVAEALHRSPSYVTTKVREATGRTVQDWIISGRMSEARRLLELTDEYVDIIAERVGYADVTHFIRLFRRSQGMTPAAWRRAHRAG